MDVRFQALLETDEPVHVTVLGEIETQLPGRMTSCSAAGIGLVADRAIEPGAAVKVELRDTLLLGEVRRCRPEGEVFEISLDLAHALYHTEELARLARRILGEERGALKK